MTLSKDQIFEILKEKIIEVLVDIPPEAITIEGRLKDLGANSVDRMEIVTLTMEELGVRIPVMDMAQVKDIKGLLDILYDKQEGSD